MSTKKAYSVPVLMYQHVTPSGGLFNTSPQNFEDQLMWLSRHGYRSLTTDEFAAHLKGEHALEKSVLITFDHGYLDNWVHAYPLLKKYGYKAVVFLVTSWVSDGPLRSHGGQPQPAPDTPEHFECERRIEQGDFDSVMLRWNEILAMQESGLIEFHHHAHMNVRATKSDSAHDSSTLSEALKQSRLALRDHLGSVSEHLCLPEGHFDTNLINVAQQSGFKYLYTSDEFGMNTTGHDPLHIHRFAVLNNTGEAMGRRIQVAAHPVIAPVFNRYKQWKRARDQQA